MSKEQSKLKTCFALLRVKQWTKNLIAYAPLLFAMKIHELPLLLAASECVIAFCLVSSAIYIVNDVVDREADKLHPKKCKRPIASGQVSVSQALILAAILAPCGLALSFYVRPTLLLILLGYVFLTLSYSFCLKRYPIVDVFAIAAGFVLRAVAGAVAIKVPSSGWFLLCTSLGALFLACEKRRQELKLLESEATEHRRSLSSYSSQLVDRMEAVILPSLLTCYIFYSFQSKHGEWMMLTVPFVLFGLLRYQMLSLSKAESPVGSPEEVLLKDRPIQVTIVLWLLTAAAVVYGYADKLDSFWR
ncbi:MAG: decaprenyl-phosphate phosphoribosyltransferase [Candidatus Obscuribacterales bacterium]|nr:decaprenyl-phosphate phosphoribosyltransferase [Candidatus Obscuribacterales bacterium]